MEAFFDKYFGTEDRFKKTFWSFSHSSMTEEDFDAFINSEVTQNAGKELKETVDGYIDNRFKENVKDDVLKFMIGSPDVQTSLDQLKQNLGVLTDETFDAFKGRLNTHVDNLLTENNVLAPIHTKINNLSNRFDDVNQEIATKFNNLADRVAVLEAQNKDLQVRINSADSMATVSLGILCFSVIASGSTYF